jgi:hypothetical protein
MNSAVRVQRDQSEGPVQQAQPMGTQPTSMALPSQRNRTVSNALCDVRLEGIRVQPPPYHRWVNARFLESICINCLKTIAYSSQPDMLTIAEKAHQCGGGPSQ